jgi:hypothetical protein
MQRKVRLPLYLSWSALKQLIGWPVSRAHTWRLMFDPKYAHDPFPLRGKIGTLVVVEDIRRVPLRMTVPVFS